MVSTGFPSVFLRMARFISPNSADVGSSSFAAIVVFALTITGSDVSAGRPDAGASTFASIMVNFAFFAASWGLPRTSAIDGFSVLVAVGEFTFVVDVLVLDDATAYLCDLVTSIHVHQRSHPAADSFCC